MEGTGFFSIAPGKAAINPLGARGNRNGEEREGRHKACPYRSLWGEHPGGCTREDERLGDLGWNRGEILAKSGGAAGCGFMARRRRVGEGLKGPFG